MKTQAVLAALVAVTMTSLARPAMAGAGQLDPSFGTGGIAVIPLNGPAGAAAKILQQPNGELLVETQGSGGIEVILLTAAGAVDTTFGVQGIATLSILGQVVEEPRDMQLQPDGSIVVVADVAAHTGRGVIGHGIVARFNANGTPDASFGNAGVVALTPLDGSVGDKPTVLLVQPNGQILVGDVSGTAGVVLRLNTDGTPDATFGKRGTAIVSRTGGAPQALALQSDGKIEAIATTAHRLLPDGTHDTTFAPGVVIASSAQQAQIGAEPPLAVQVDDSYLVSGTTGSVDQFFALQRFKLTNKVAKSLQSVEIGFDGTKTTNTSQDYANIVQPNGSIVVAGRYLAGSDECFGLGRLLRNGALDTSFGSNGTVTTVFPGNNALATALALQSDGNIVAAGITGSSGSVAVARYLGH